MSRELKNVENLIARKVELIKALQEAIKEGKKANEWVLRGDIEDLEEVIRKNS